MSPTLVRAEDLIAWSDRFEAAALLPELVRRLLLATAAPRRLEMRSGAGVRLPGFDGILDARAGGAFWPIGTSFWELSVSSGTAAKADEDYQKRTSTCDRAVRSAVGYVVATSRRWPRKSEWAAARRAEQEWSDTRVIDADDLAAWLAEAPAVALWFANTQLGRPTDDEVDLGSYLDAWRHRTQPALPAGLPLIGRDSEVEKVAEWWRSSRASGGETLVVADDTRDEALAFVAAALMTIPDAPSRCVVVFSERSLRWNANHVEVVLLTAFAQPSLLPANKARVVVGAARSDVNDSKAIRLARQRREEIAQALAAAGVLPADAAGRLVQEAGGRLAALQRLLGYVQRPTWAGRASLEILQVLALLGAWAPRSEGDQAAVGGMGIDPDRLEYECASLVDIEDAPLARRDRTFAWRARGDAWALLAPAFSPGLLARFERVAADVLSQDDPGFELDVEKRFYAAILGKVPRSSSALREGLAEGLLRLATSDHLLRQTAGVRAGSALASRVVHHILHAEWKRWASLDRLLPTLAEAAPDAFIERLRESVATSPGGVAELLSQVTGFSNPMTGLLWALERVAWLSDHVDAVVDLLAELALRDRAKHNWVNRPAHSLQQILFAWLPQSATSADDRIRFLDRLVERWPDVAWGIVLSHFDQFGMMTTTPRPEYRTFAEAGETARADGMRQVATARRHAVALAGTATDRLAKLLDVSVGDSELRESVLTSILAQSERVDDPLGLWGALRRQIYLVHLRHEGEALPPELPRLQNVYDALTPADRVAKVGWLFEGFTDLPDDTAGDFHRQQARARELRASAVAEIYRQEGWSRVGSLGRFGAHPLPGLVAEALVDAKLGDEAAERFLDPKLGTELGEVGAVAAALVGAALNSSWLDDAFARLLEQGRSEDAVLVALRVPHGPDHWDRLERLGEPLRSEYWRRVWPPGVKSSGDVERAAREMLRVDRPDGAIDVLSGTTQQIAPDVCLEALESLALRLKNEATRTVRFDTYQVEQLLKRLGADPNADEQRLIGVELRFLGAFREYEPGARLYKVIADDPAQFVTLVTLCYRAEDEEPREPTKEEIQAAKGAQIILEHWKGYPAYGRPASERETMLQDWAERCLTQLRDARRSGIGGIVVGTVLARVANGEDGIWPCVAARNLLETGQFPTLADGLSTAKRNLRGVVTKSMGEGGVQERQLADTFRADAAQLKGAHPRTAELLRKLADRYEADSEREEERAEVDREKYDLGPPTASRQATVSAPIEAAPTLEAKLTALAEERRKEDAGTDWAAEKAVWLDALAALYADVKRWVAEWAGKGLLSSRDTNWPLLEEKIGSYEAPGLEIEASGAVIVLEPVGTLIVGARGRVDVYRQGRRERAVMLVLPAPGSWEVWTTRDNRKPLSSATFETLLGELLGG